MPLAAASPADEIAVAGDEDARALIRQVTQQLANLRVEGVGQVVVADPVLEQVAENEQRIDFGRARIDKKRSKALRQIGPLGPQMQVGDYAGGSGDGQHGTASMLQTTSARSMMTSAAGTFWWKLLLAVFTDLIWSTTSW